MLSVRLAIVATTLLRTQVEELPQELPTVSQLISETQALANSMKQEAPFRAADTAIARALLSAGRHEEGFRLVKSLHDDISLIAYAEKFTEHHNAALPLQKADFGNEISYVQYRSLMAQVLYSKDKLKEAESIRPLDNKTRLSAIFLADYYAWVAEDLISKHQNATANQMLSKSLDYRVRLGERSFRIKKLESLAQNFILVGDRLSAEKCEALATQQLQPWLQRAASLGPTQKHGCSEDCCRLAVINHILGNTSAAEQWFQSANSILDDAAPDTAQYQQSLLADQIAEIGIHQLKTGRSALGKQTIERSIAILLNLPANDQCHHLVETIRKLCEVGQTQFAISKTNLISNPYWKIRATHACCRALAEAGEIDTATELLRQAETVARKETSGANERTACLLECALIWEQNLAESKQAAKCIDAARKISTRKKCRYHQRIAFYEVRLKMFSSAYASIKKIGQAQYKLRPLAELTLRVAEAAR